MKAEYWRVVLTLAAVAILLSIGVVPTVSADNGGVDVVLYPTGLYPQDVENVQAAVDLGGTILLKATDAQGIPTAFNFGVPFVDSGYVLLSNDVSLQGETIGSDMTTILGGAPPFLGFSPVESTVRGIHFDGPGIAALDVLVSTGIDFSFNRVTDVVGLPNYMGLGISKGQAVWVATDAPGYISGEVMIADNVIDGISGDLAYGLALFIFGAETHIVRNDIRGAQSGGILAALNTQPVWIEDNIIVPGPTGSSGEPGNGIMAQWPIGRGVFYIRGNIIECESPLADGIYLFGDGFNPVKGSVIEHNRVVMHDTFYAGISLYGDVEHTRVAQNHIKGSGSFAVQSSTGFVLDDIATSNTFVGNNIAGFQSRFADVFLDINTENTAFAGLSGSVIDLGDQNLVTGFTKTGLSEAFGQQIREAQALKRSTWRSQQSVTTVRPPY